MTFSSFTSSFTELMHGQSPDEAQGTRQEEIRTAMLASLADIESSQPDAFSRTLVTITQAADVQSLWEARSELLRLIADRDGELAARKTLDGITEMFRGLVPHNLLPTRRRVPR
jgi:hypothetical protein